MARVIAEAAGATGKKKKQASIAQQAAAALRTAVQSMPQAAAQAVSQAKAQAAMPVNSAGQAPQQLKKIELIESDRQANPFFKMGPSPKMINQAYSDLILSRGAAKNAVQREQKLEKASMEPLVNYWFKTALDNRKSEVKKLARAYQEHVGKLEKLGQSIQTESDYNKYLKQWTEADSLYEQYEKEYTDYKDFLSTNQQIYSDALKRWNQAAVDRQAAAQKLSDADGAYKSLVAQAAQNGNWLDSSPQVRQDVMDYQRGILKAGKEWARTRIAEINQEMQANADEFQADRMKVASGAAGMNSDMLRERQTKLNDEKLKLQEYLRQAEDAEKVTGLEKQALAANDFEKLCRYKSTANGKMEEFSIYTPGQLSESGFNDLEYEYINGTKKAVELLDASETATGKYFAGIDRNYLKQMTAKEVKIYNYFYAKDGKEKADEYLKAISSELTKKQRIKTEAHWAEEAQKHPVQSSLFSILESPLKGVSYLGQIADYVDDGKIDQNAGYNKFSYTNSAIRNEVSKIAKKKWGETGSFLYQTGMSMGDFLLNTGITGGNEALSLALMGTGAAAGAVISAKDRGLSDTQAFLTGTVAGAAEIVTEKISIEKLLDTTALGKNAVGYLVQNALSEGSEEVGSDLINLVADAVINGDKSEWEATKRQYRTHGLSEQEASRKAFLDQIQEIAMDFFGGALSGSAMAGAGIAGSKAFHGIQSRQNENLHSQIANSGILTKAQLQNLINYNSKMVENTQSQIPQYSLQAFSDGQRFVDVQTDQAQFEGLAASEKSKLAENVIKKRFAGKVIGIDNPVFVNGHTAGEYGHPAKRIENETREAKARASTELDNLIDAGTNFRTAPDGADGHIHPNATGGFSYFDTIFKVGNEYYKGVINIENTAKGRRLKDITKIENITQDICSSYGKNPKSTFLRDTSMNSIPTSPEKVNYPAPFGVDPIEWGRRLRRAASTDTTLAYTAALYNVNEAAYAAAEKLAKETGAKIVFDGTLRGNENGYYQNGEIHINPNAEGNFTTVFAHELTHHLEGTGAYQALSDYVLSHFGSADAISKAIEQKIAEYDRDSSGRVKLSEADARAELVAQYISENLFSNEGEILRFAKSNLSLAQRVKSFLSRLTAKVTGNTERQFLLNAERLYQKAINEARKGTSPSTKTVARANSITGDSIVDSEGSDTPSREEIEANIKTVAQMDSVISITGIPFEPGKNLRQDVLDFIEKQGEIRNLRLGAVLFNKNKIRGDIAHGIGPEKAASYAAVPAVIREGGVVDYQKDYDGSGNDRATIAAPITMNSQGYMACVVVKRSHGENRFYIHEVLAINENEVSRSTRGIAEATGHTSGDTPSINRILQKLIDVKRKMSSTPPYSLKGTETGNANTHSSVDKAVQMLDNGYTPNEVYAQTGLVVMANGDIYNGIGGEKIGEYLYGDAEDKLGEISNVVPSIVAGVDGRADTRGMAKDGRMVPVSGVETFGETSRANAKGEFRATSRGISSNASGVDRRTGSRGLEGNTETLRLAGWEQLDGNEQSRITAAVETHMSTAGDEGKLLLNKFSGIEAFTERFYSMLQQGRPVAEQWADFIPDIQGLMDEIEAAIDNTGGRKYSLAEEEKQNKKLLRENERLKREFTRTTVKKPSESRVKVEAGKILSGISSKYDKETFANEINALYTFMLNGEKTENGKNVELSFEAVKADALNIAGRALSEVRLKSEATDTEVRDYFKNTRINVSENVRRDMGNWADFRKAHRRDMQLTTDGSGVPVDIAIQEIEDILPSHILNRQNPADQLEAVGEYLKATASRTYNPFEKREMDFEMEQENLANEILERFWEIPQQKTTFADKKALELIKEKIRGAKRLDALSEKHRAQIQAEREKGKARALELKKFSTEHAKEVRQKEREKGAKRLEAQKEKYDGKIEKDRESRKAQSLRRSIEKMSKEFSKKLLHPTSEQHIPDELTGAIAKALEAVNLESGFSVDESGPKKLHLPTWEGSPTKRTQAFRALRETYTKIANSPEWQGQLVTDPDLQANLDEIISMKDTPITNLSSGQLTTILNTLKAVRHSISSVNQMFSSEQRRRISEVGEDVMSELDKRREKKSHRGIAGKVDELLNVQMLKPYYWFQLSGKGGMSVYRMLRNAQDQQTRDFRAVSEFTNGLLTEKEYREWSTDDKPEKFTVPGGTLELTTAQKMALYVSMKREQAKRHILQGGIKTQAADSNKRTNSAYIPVKPGEVSIAKITATLTDRQREVADKIMEYMSTTLAGWGNEASLKVYGYRKFTEQHYIPIKSDSNYVKRNLTEQSPDATIEGKGFTKSTVQNAANPVIIRDIFDVFADHACEMSAYHSYLAALKDAERVYNYSLSGYEGSVRQSLERTLGARGRDYFQTLIRDINGMGNSRHDWTPGKLLSNFKRASVAANIRVVIQQPTAYFRALNVLGADSLFSPKALVPKNWELIKEFAPIAQWKDWGYFGMNTGRELKNIILNSDTKGQRAMQKTMWLAGKADEITWKRLWAACEIEVRKENKALWDKVKQEYRTVKSSDQMSERLREYYETVGEKFSGVVDRTQVVDGVLQRSQIMRSPDGLSKMATSFMAEPTTTYNVAWSAIDSFRNARTRERKATAGKLARASAALLVTGVINAACQSVIDALRDDDDDETYMGKWLEAFTGIEGNEENAWDYGKNILTGNLADNLNPLGWIPFAKDLLSILQGYDVERMDMSAAADMLHSLNAWITALGGEGKKSVLEATMDFAGKAAKLFGVPVYNIKRDLDSIVQTVINGLDNPVIDYRYNKARRNPQNAKSTFYDILFQTIREGDNEAYRLIAGDMVENGFTWEQIRTAMKERYKKAIEETPELAGDKKLMERAGVSEEAVKGWKKDAFLASWKEDPAIAEDAEAMKNAGVTAEDIRKWEESQWKESGYIDDLKKAGADLFAVEEVVRDIKNAGTDAEKMQALLDSGLPEEQQRILFNTFAGEKDKERLTALEKSGIFFEDFLKIKMAYSGFDGEDIKATEKRGKFAQWLTARGFSKAEMETIHGQFAYYSGAVADSSLYEKLTAGGVSDGIAMNLSFVLGDLQPAEDAEQISDLQRWKAIVEDDIAEEEMIKAIEALMTEDSQRGHLEGVLEQDISVKDYIGCLSSTMGLQPLPGEKSVLNSQRWDAVANSQYSDTVKAATMKTLMSEKQAAALDEIVGAGVSLSDFAECYRSIEGLVPEEGKDSVSEKQKKAAIAFSGSDDTVKYHTLRMVMDDGPFGKMTEARERGVGTEAFMDYYLNSGEIKGNKDENGKTLSGDKYGSRKNKILTYIDDIPNLTNEQKDALAQFEYKEWSSAPWHGGARYEGDLPEHYTVNGETPEQPPHQEPPKTTDVSTGNSSDNRSSGGGSGGTRGSSDRNREGSLPKVADLSATTASTSGYGSWFTPLSRFGITKYKTTPVYAKPLTFTSVNKITPSANKPAGQKVQAVNSTGQIESRNSRGADTTKFYKI